MDAFHGDASGGIVRAWSGCAFGNHHCDFHGYVKCVSSQCLSPSCGDTNRAGDGTWSVVFDMAWIWHDSEDTYGSIYVLFSECDCFGANKWQIYQYVKIPAAMNALFSGIKVSATYCIGGAIVGEWLSASAGLGYYMIRVKNGYMLDKVFACVVVIIVWSLLLHMALTWLERIVFPYQRKRRGKQT